MSTIYRVTCEWDIGQEYLAFRSILSARRWCEDNEVLAEVLDSDDCTLAELEGDGLVGFISLELTGERDITAEEGAHRT